MIRPAVARRERRVPARRWNGRPSSELNAPASGSAPDSADRPRSNPMHRPVGAHGQRVRQGGFRVAACSRYAQGVADVHHRRKGPCHVEEGSQNQALAPVPSAGGASFPSPILLAITVFIGSEPVNDDLAGVSPAGRRRVPVGHDSPLNERDFQETGRPHRPLSARRWAHADRRVFTRDNNSSDSHRGSAGAPQFPRFRPAGGRSRCPMQKRRDATEPSRRASMHRPRFF